MKNLAQLFADQIIAQHRNFEPLDRTYLINKIYALVGEKNLQAPIAQLNLLELVNP